MAGKRSKPVILRPVDEQPDGQTIEILERSLAEAKNGELIGVAVVGVRRGGTVNTCFSGGPVHHQLVSGAAWLMYRLQKANDPDLE